MATITYIRQLEEKRGLFFQIGLTIALLITWASLQLTLTYTVPVMKSPDTETEQMIIEVPIIKNNPASPPVTVRPRVNKPSVTTTIVTTAEPIAVDKPIEIIAPDNPDPVITNNSAHSSSPLFVPPVLPEFSGGMEALYRFLQANLKYDKKAVKEGITGTVYLNFRVDEYGEISDIKILKGVHPLLDSEAIRVVSMMPRWNPGRNYDGSPVVCTFNLPVNFRLK